MKNFSGLGQGKYRFIKNLIIKNIGMKKYAKVFSLFFVSLSFLFFGCHKDKTAPMIFLTGPNPMTVILGTTLVDPGATGDDNADGSSITNKITSTTTVVMDASHITTLAADTFRITYFVKDKAGNSATKIRTVKVINSMHRFSFSTTSGNIIDYLVTKTNDIPADTISFPDYSSVLGVKLNKPDSILTDARKNNRIIFTSICKGITNPTSHTTLSGSLRVYCDVVVAPDKNLYIDIPSQVLRKTDNLPPYNEYAYQVTSIGHGLSSQCRIDTAYQHQMDNFAITLRYTVVKLQKLLASDPTYLRVWQDTLSHTWFGGTLQNPLYYKTANCTETFYRQ